MALHIVELIDRDRRVEVLRSLDRATTVGRDYLLLVLLSCIIATFGLVLDSPAVIIGAMLIAPLMSPILAFALALVRGDLRRLVRNLAALLVGVLLAIVLSALLGRLVSAGEVNFLEEMPAEIVGRTRPTLFDLVIALAGGAAAAYALAQPHLSATLPGVAIATALMPPVCVAGIGVSQGLDHVSRGALLLFLANFVAIVFAGSLVFAAVGFGPLARARRRIILPGALLLSSALLLLVAVPLFGFMARTVADARENATIRATLIRELTRVSAGSSLVGFKKQPGENYLNIVATVRSPQDITLVDGEQVQRQVAARLRRSVKVTLLLIPVTKLEPSVPSVNTASSP